MYSPRDSETLHRIIMHGGCVGTLRCVYSRTVSHSPAAKILLAPMEGVIDHTMRDLLTRLGGIDRCVTEFLRVSHELLPARVFYRICPELRDGGYTPSGVPVYLQLLGGNPELLAANAARAAQLGAPGIDLNLAARQKPSTDQTAAR